MNRQRLALGLLALLMAIASYIICIGKDAIQTNRMGDAALFEQIIENIHAGKGAVSNVFANTQNIIDHGYIGQPDAELLARELRGELAHPTEQERSMLGFHAYYILYPISLLLWLMSSSMALVFVQTVACSLLVWLAAYYVMVRTQSKTMAFLSGMLVFLSPQLFLTFPGQFYPDRIFLALGFVLLSCLHFEVRWRWLLLVSFLIVLVNERAALIGGLLVGMHAALFCWSNRRRFFIQLILAAGLVVYALMIKKLVLTNLYYDSYLPVNWDDLVYRYTKLPNFAADIQVNLKNNAVLLVLGLFAPRYFLMALVVLTPNLIGNIGGAEKIGWLTHYHSYYFPVLCFAALTGICNIYTRGLYQFNKLIIIGVALCVGFVWFSQEKRILNGISSPSSVMRDFAFTYLSKHRGESSGYDLRRDIEAEFIPGSLVATKEPGIAMLHKRAQVTVYPLRLSEADFVYVNCLTLAERMPASAGEYAGRSVNEVLEEHYGFSMHKLSREPGYCIGEKLVKRSAE